MEVGVSGEHWPSGGVNAALHILSSLSRGHHLAIDLGVHEGETSASNTCSWVIEDEPYFH